MEEEERRIYAWYSAGIGLKEKHSPIPPIANVCPSDEPPARFLVCKSSIENGLKKAYIPQMDLGIMKIKIRIIPFAHGIGYIENARLRFKSQPQTKTQKTII